MYNQVNRILYSGALIFLFSTAIFVSCQTRHDNKADAKENITGNQNSDWQVFKASTEESIANNDERINALKEKIQQPGTANLDKLRQKQVNNLEDRNTALRARLMEYKEDNIAANLEQFKSEILKELEEMEKSLKELDNK